MKYLIFLFTYPEINKNQRVKVEIHNPPKKCMKESSGRKLITRFFHDKTMLRIANECTPASVAMQYLRGPDAQ